MEESSRTATIVFHNEKKYYNYSNPHYDTVYAHFTQLVWKVSEIFNLYSHRGSFYLNY